MAKPRKPLTDAVMALLDAGQTPEQIAAETELDPVFIKLARERDREAARGRRRRAMVFIDDAA